MKSCKECGEPLRDPIHCEACGWTAKNFQPTIKQCFACHNDIPNDKYYRIFRLRENGVESLRYKCAGCLLYADLSWRDKAIVDWLKAHPEFQFTPKNDQDQKDLQEMCMAYIRKITKGGVTRKLPYDKTRKIEKLEYNEHELLAQLPKSDFSDLEDRELNLHF